MCPCDDDAAHDAVLLFSESPSRFLLEVRPEHARAPWPTSSAACPWAGSARWPAPTAIRPAPRLTVRGLDGSPVIDAPVADLKAAWQRPLRW